MQRLLGLFLIASTAAAMAQPYKPALTTQGVPETSQPAREAPTLPVSTETHDPAAGLPDAPSHTLSETPVSVSKQPPGIVPSFNAPGSGAPSLPLTSRQYLNFANLNSEGTASLVFVGGNAASDADTHQETTGSGPNCGRTSADKSNGSDWINTLVSLTSHKGGRYCALGEGGFWKRGTYAATRAFVAHRFDSSNSFNASELLGPGIASAVPGSYYAYPNYTGERLAARYASAVGRDTLKNMFSEFWPDFATHVLHRHP